ncbi:hypothetical protein [Flavobacterium sp. XGLA_31]|uniref:hypothetical protein n=1 Tax=Flavobacterium sp. XGLA_31 TaxID=3447666 RepID=UPI003F3D88B5
MKKLFLLLAIAFLFQSCFSYKKMENDPLKMEPGKKYKIERNNKNYKVTFDSLTDKSILITRKNRTKEEIPINEITSIRKRKFSIGKTVALPVTIAATVTGIFILTYDGPNINLDGFTMPN